MITEKNIRVLRNPRYHRNKHDKKSSIGKTAKQYASTSTAHGLAYIVEDGRSYLERIFWIFVTALAVFFTAFQTIQLYSQWKNDPVVTSLDTVKLPISEIEFPAITICPQGSVNEIMNSVLFKQFKEYVSEKRSRKRLKRSSSLESSTIQQTNDKSETSLNYDAMMEEAEQFLKDVYPGAKGNPTKMIQAMTAKDPGKSIASQALLNPSSEESECDPSDNLDLLETLNKQLINDSCPNGFEMLKESKTCIHESSELYSYEDATKYCTEKEGADILYFVSYEEVEDLKHSSLNFSSKLIPSTPIFYLIMLNKIILF